MGLNSGSLIAPGEGPRRPRKGCFVPPVEGEAVKQAREQLATKPNTKLMAQAKKNVEAAKALAAELAAT